MSFWEESIELLCKGPRPDVASGAAAAGALSPLAGAAARAALKAAPKAVKEVGEEKAAAAWMASREKARPKHVRGGVSSAKNPFKELSESQVGRGATSSRRPLKTSGGSKSDMETWAEGVGDAAKHVYEGGKSFGRDVMSWHPAGKKKVKEWRKEEAAEEAAAAAEKKNIKHWKTKEGFSFRPLMPPSQRKVIDPESYPARQHGGRVKAHLARVQSAREAKAQSKRLYKPSPEAEGMMSKFNNLPKERRDFLLRELVRYNPNAKTMMSPRSADLVKQFHNPEFITHLRQKGLIKRQR